MLEKSANNIMSIKTVVNYSKYLTGRIDLTQHSKLILQQLLQLSILFGKPLYFTSSFRTPKQNRICGGSPTSSHLKGLAFDIKCTTSLDRYRLIDSIHILGIKRYGVYKNFIHVDFDDSKPQNVAWYE